MPRVGRRVHTRRTSLPETGEVELRTVRRMRQGLASEVDDEIDLFLQGRQIGNDFRTIFFQQEWHVIAAEIGVADPQGIGRRLQGFDERQHRAVAQIVAAGLVRQAVEAQTPAMPGTNRLQTGAQMGAIARGNGSEKRHLRRRGQRQQGAEILFEASTAKSESRLEVRRREVELRILAKQAQDLVAVDVLGVSHAREFVGKTDLERVKGIICELEKLGGASRNLLAGASRVLKNRLNGGSRCRIVRTQHDERRVIEIGERVTFAEKLGNHRESEIDACFPAALHFEQGPQFMLREMHGHRAAHDHRMEVRGRAKPLRQRHCGCKNELGIELPAAGGRRWQAQDGGVGHGPSETIGSGAEEMPAGHGGRDAIRETWFSKIGFGRVETGDLLRVDVHADNTMSMSRQACGADQSGVSEPPDFQLHDTKIREMMASIRFRY